MEEELEKELKEMCNLSEGIEENALRKGKQMGRKAGRREGRREGKREGMDMERIRSVNTLMSSLHFPLEKALEALGITMQEYTGSLNHLRKVSPDGGMFTGE